MGDILGRPWEWFERGASKRGDEDPLRKPRGPVSWKTHIRNDHQGRRLVSCAKYCQKPGHGG